MHEVEALVSGGLEGQDAQRSPGASDGLLRQRNIVTIRISFTNCDRTVTYKLKVHFYHSTGAVNPLLLEFQRTFMLLLWWWRACAVFPQGSCKRSRKPQCNEHLYRIFSGTRHAYLISPHFVDCVRISPDFADLL